MNMYAKWQPTSSAHSLLMFPVFYLLTWGPPPPPTMFRVHLKPMCRKWLPLSFPSPVQVASHRDDPSHSMGPPLYPSAEPKTWESFQISSSPSPPPLIQLAVEFGQYRLLHVSQTLPSSSHCRRHSCTSVVSSLPGLPDFHPALPSPPATISHLLPQI